MCYRKMAPYQNILNTLNIYIVSVLLRLHLFTLEGDKETGGPGFEFLSHQLRETKDVTPFCLTSFFCKMGMIELNWKFACALKM
jgi:hypothetical protein